MDSASNSDFKAGKRSQSVFEQSEGIKNSTTEAKERSRCWMDDGSKSRIVGAKKHSLLSPGA
jgi:hypothetical protein